MLSWTLAVFFGCSIGFAAIRKATEDQGAGVTLAAQLAFLVLVVVVLVVVVRRQGGGADD